MKIKQDGFTLAELMVVVAILGILAAIAVPNIIAATADYGLKAAARDLSSLMRKARSKAIRERRQVVIALNFSAPGDKTDGWYVFDDGSTCSKILPHAGSLDRQYGGGVHFGYGKAKKGASSTLKLPAVPTTFQGRKIKYNSMGVCNSGYVYLSNKKGSAIAIGSNSTGLTKYKQWNGSAWK